LKGSVLVKLHSGRIRRVELHWYEAHGIGKRKIKIKRYLQPKFVICVRNGDAEDLEIRKIYQVIPDEAASTDGLLRVVDESGEDYLYPADLFIQIELPQAIEKALLPAA